MFLIFFAPPVISHIKTFSTKALSAPSGLFYGIGEAVQNKQKLIKENQALQAREIELSLELDQSGELISENERLRGLLNFKKKIGFNTISAEVIARDPNDWLSSFVINKGKGDGIKKDSAVCASKGLLGKVVELGEHTSSVMLLSHPAFKAGGMVKKSRINGIVVGAGKGLVKMKYIPIDAEVKTGDTVVTSGMSSIFPKGIAIGEVISVGKNKTGLYQYAMIKPFADPLQQEEVLCLAE